jgi:hypothetical protein
MPKDPSPPPMPLPASTPVLPPVPVKPEGPTQTGAGERRKRKYANYCHPRYFLFCRDFLAEHLKWVSERDKSVLKDASFFLLL